MLHLLFVPLPFFPPFLPLGPLPGLVPFLLVGLLVWLVVSRSRPSPPPTLSGDGHWWWDGRRWIPTVSSDGKWRWTGDTWEPTTS